MLRVQDSPGVDDDGPPCRAVTSATPAQPRNIASPVRASFSLLRSHPRPLHEASESLYTGIAMHTPGEMSTVAHIEGAQRVTSVHLGARESAPSDPHHHHQQQQQQQQAQPPQNFRVPPPSLAASYIPQFPDAWAITLYLGACGAFLWVLVTVGPKLGGPDFPGPTAQAGGGEAVEGIVLSAWLASIWPCVGIALAVAGVWGMVLVLALQRFGGAVLGATATCLPVLGRGRGACGGCGLRRCQWSS
jgi:hypothetical protein